MEEKQKLERYEIQLGVIDNILVELLYRNGVINKKTYENYKKKFGKDCE